MEDSDNIVRRRESPPLAKEKRVQWGGKGEEAGLRRKKPSQFRKVFFSCVGGMGEILSRDGKETCVLQKNHPSFLGTFQGGFY